MGSWLNPGDVNALFSGYLDARAKANPYEAAIINELPFVGTYARINEQNRRLNDYVQGRGLSWSQVQYPLSSSAEFLPTFSSSIQLGRFGKSYRRNYRRSRKARKMKRRFKYGSRY